MDWSKGSTIIDLEDAEEKAKENLFCPQECLLKIIPWRKAYRISLAFLCNLSLFISAILTGLGQCTELVTQLRGEAGPRQVEGARNGLQHNFGIGGAAVVTIYRKPTFPSYQQLTAKL